MLFYFTQSFFVVFSAFLCCLQCCVLFFYMTCLSRDVNPCSLEMRTEKSNAVSQSEFNVVRVSNNNGENQVLKAQTMWPDLTIKE